MTAPQTKRRDAEATRDRILQCAKQLFAEKGYDATGTREIAACAEVNVALVARYFGSKKQLFEDALMPEFDVAPLLDLHGERFAEGLAALFAHKGPKEDFDPMLALIRSAGSEDVGDVVQKIMNDQVIAPLSKAIGGAHAEQRAALLMAQLAGFDLFRRIIGLDAMAPEHDQTNEGLLLNSINPVIREERANPGFQE